MLSITKLKIASLFCGFAMGYVAILLIQTGIDHRFGHWSHSNEGLSKSRGLNH